MLILEPADVDRCLDAHDCLTALEEAYLELGRAAALDQPRTDLWLPGAAGEHYILKTMAGALPGSEVAALRLNSSLIRWRDADQGMRKEGARPGFVGLVLLFCTRTGELLCVFPDRQMQRLRVAATTGLAATRLARADASAAAILGSGGQARAALTVLNALFHLRTARVWSPNHDHRSAFAREMQARLGIEVRPAATAQEAVRGTHIVCCATSSIDPVIAAEWLEPGSFVSCVKHSEITAEVLAHCNRVVVHTRLGDPISYVSGRREPVAKHDPIAPGGSGERWSPDWNSYPDLTELIAGKVSARQSQEERTCFINNIGLGIQFAALGRSVYQRARALQIGRELPPEWFTQDL